MYIFEYLVKTKKQYQRKKHRSMVNSRIIANIAIIPVFRGKLVHAKFLAILLLAICVLPVLLMSNSLTAINEKMIMQAGLTSFHSSDFGVNEVNRGDFRVKSPFTLNNHLEENNVLPYNSEGDSPQVLSADFCLDCDDGFCHLCATTAINNLFIYHDKKVTAAFTYNLVNPLFESYYYSLFRPPRFS